MADPQEIHDQNYVALVEQLRQNDITAEAFTIGVKNLKTFSDSRPPKPEPDLVPDPVPTTWWDKTKATTTKVWDNETTRVALRAGGAFAGVALVVWSTVHKDHVLERQAIAQANQRTT